MAYEMGMYTILAEYYDYIYDEYVRDASRRWADFVVDIVGERGLVLDIACGTGAPTSRLVERGLDVICLDLNRPMLVVGRERRLGRAAELVEGDARRLPLRSLSFDAATMFFSSISYIGPFEELVEFMRSVRGVLREGGVFVFDSFNPLRPRTGAGAPVVWDTPGPGGEHLFIIDYREYEDLRGVVVFKRLITVIKPDGIQRSFLVVDRLYAYTANEFRIALREAGFRSVEVYGDYRRERRETPTGNRIVVVARA